MIEKKIKNLIKEYKNEKFVIEGKIKNITKGNNTYLISVEILNVLENKEVILNTHFLSAFLENINNYKVGDIAFFTGRMDKKIYEIIYLKNNEKSSWTDISAYFDKIETGKPTEEKQEEKLIEEQKNNNEIVKKTPKIIDFSSEIISGRVKKKNKKPAIKEEVKNIKPKLDTINIIGLDEIYNGEEIDDSEIVKKHKNEKPLVREFKNKYT